MNISNQINRLLVIGIVSLVAAGCASNNKVENEQELSATSATEEYSGNRKVEDEYGIRIESIQLTAANYMLHFNYKIIDAEKAKYLMDRKIKPYIIVERTGSQLQVPVTAKLGALRGSPKFPKEGKKYWMFFANPGMFVKSGEKVSVVIGDFKVEHITVL